ncbi:MAG: HEAT repeat domain-containing protein [Thermoguttaceae bacterium]
MSVPFKHRFGPDALSSGALNSAVLIGALAVGLLGTGCQWLPEGRLPRLLTSSGDKNRSTDELQDAAATGPEASTAFAAEDRAVLARHSDEEQLSLWIQTVRRGEDSTERVYRWRYPALEELLARPATKRPDLHGYLGDRSSTVVANASIALARLGDDAGAEHLADAVRTPALPSAMRCAAAEALATLSGSTTLPDPTALRLIRELIDQYGRPGASDHHELHEELILGLARHVDTADDKRFIAALQSPSEDVQVAALNAFSDERRGTLPPQIVKLTAHAAARVRTAALQTLAGRKHPEALARLSAALNDHDVRVRIEAVASLGQLGGSEAEATLQRLLDTSPHERIRGEAVTALGLMGVKRPVLETLDDESWQVRQRAARALARFPDRDSAVAAEELLGDPSVKVQSEVITALGQWPLPLAGPILIEALDSSCLTTRHAAAEQLATRWAPAADLADGTKEKVSSDRLDELRIGFRQQFGGIDHNALSRALAGRRPERTIPASEVDRIEGMVVRGDIAQIEQLGPELLPALEQIVFDRQQALPVAIYRKVLLRHGPEYIALDQMDMSDLLPRRRATAKLAELAGERPLSRLATLRLYQLVAGDPDQLVWQNALRAVERNPHEPAIRLAYTATGHPSPEVRRRACENLAACPQPQHAQVLLETLKDKDTSDSVVCAAVHALGALGRIDDTGPLQRLMAATNENVRVETAIALARLGDKKGTAGLERLAHSNDPAVQYRVAVAMGEMPDPAFVPILIGLLDAKMAVSRGALNSLPKVLGRDVASENGQSSATTTQRIQRWKRWYYRQASAGQQNGLRSF